jgi:hypothetical protein
MTLEQRLERLERENWWMRRIGVVGAAVLAAVVLMGQGKAERAFYADSIETRKLVILDPKGRKRAWLTTESLRRSPDEFYPVLLFRDDAGKRSIYLGGGRAPQLALAKGETRVGLFIGAVFGNPAFSWSRGRGIDKNLLSIVMRNNDHPVMEFRNRAGDVIWKAPEEDLKVRSLSVQGEDGKVRAYLGTRADGSPGLKLFDAKGKVIWQAPKD